MGWTNQGSWDDKKISILSGDLQYLDFGQFHSGTQKVWFLFCSFCKSTSKIPLWIVMNWQRGRVKASTEAHWSFPCFLPPSSVQEREASLAGLCVSRCFPAVGTHPSFIISIDTPVLQVFPVLRWCNKATGSSIFRFCFPIGLGKCCSKEAVLADSSIS